MTLLCGVTPYVLSGIVAGVGYIVKEFEYNGRFTYGVIIDAAD